MNSVQFYFIIIIDHKFNFSTFALDLMNDRNVIKYLPKFDEICYKCKRLCAAKRQKINKNKNFNQERRRTKHCNKCLQHWPSDEYMCVVGLRCVVNAVTKFALTEVYGRARDSCDVTKNSDIS